MGVLACDRKGCENIMCDNVSHERNEYLCWECKQELIEGGACDIDTFMGTRKVEYEDDGSWEDLVNHIFCSRYEED